VSTKRSAWPIAFVVVALAALGTATFVFYETRNEIRSAAAAFRTGTVTTSFLSYATEVSGSSYLQFASLKEMEVFERTDSAAVLWGQLALPDVVVRAEAPVEYTYYLDLDKAWTFELSQDARSVLVLAPAIEFNAPSIDVSRIRYDVQSGSLLRDERRALENLRKGLTGLARRRAGENVELVRELGRKKTEDFIRSWFLSSYDGAESYRIQVFFPDEESSFRERLNLHVPELS
jgi:hypothetical protein